MRKRERVASPVSELGKAVIAIVHSFMVVIDQAGRTGVFLFQVLHQLFTGPIRWGLIVKQMHFVGVSSLFIVMLTGAFTGMVLALQTGRALALFSADTLTGAVAVMAITRELGPTLTALMVTARAGSAMAAQLGTMKVTQQVDALVSMAVNPIGFLIVPRIVATILVVPLLTALFDFIGTLGSYVVGVKLLQIDEAIFLHNLTYFVDVPDLVEGLFKSAVFAFILSLISCYKGYTASGGAEGVGRATTQAVVISSVLILVNDYFLTALLF